MLSLLFITLNLKIVKLFCIDIFTWYIAAVANYVNAKGVDQGLRVPGVNGNYLT